MFTKVALTLALIKAVLAQAPLYGQCGGEGWTGATTCVSGAVCVEQNPYYSQCVAGTATSTTTTSKTSSTSVTKTTTTASKTTTTSTTSKTTTTTTTSPVTTATQYCGQWDDPTFGNYILYLDQWGESGATSGSDCAWVTAQSGNSISWVTQWTWVGGTGVKSYTNVALTKNLGLEISAITSIPTTWDWTITNSAGIVADVAYDLFTSNSASGGNQYEIMIWLANYNAGPISYTYSSSGSPTPVASAVSIGGYTWDVYYGNNGSNYVYSFLPSSGSPVQSFSSDLLTFFKYLIANQSFSSSQYLTTVEAGTEATTGSAVTLTTTAYSVVIN